MDKLSKTELQSTISKQNEQLKRYESRLRDAVTAYKGLIREKKALEESLLVINNAKLDGENNSLGTLTASITTLTAEKARMEEAFQNDKRVTKEQYERNIRELQDELESVKKQKQLELDNVRAKLIFEIQEREREHTEHALMIKEFQLKLGSERRLKEKLEDKVTASSDAPNNSEFEKKFRDLSSELEATQRKLQRAEARTSETPQLLVQLQEEITQMKQNHVAALREEKFKAKKAEEHAKYLCESQEEQVAVLEARLAELSETVSEYDRQRRKDQELIQQLKDNVSLNIPKGECTDDDKYLQLNEGSRKVDESNKTLNGMPYLQDLIDKLHLLKKEIIVTNETLGGPIDIWNIFNTNNTNVQNIHSACKAELAALRTEYELYKRQSVNENSSGEYSLQRNVNKHEIDRLKSIIKTLQDKVDMLNQQIEESETESNKKIVEVNQKLRKTYEVHKEEIDEYEKKVISLEQQLHSQRERYATLLGERDLELKIKHEKENEKYGSKDNISGSLHEASAPPHMLHYAHELARRDLDITTLRKEKHILETQLRDSRRESAINKDRHKDIQKSLHSEIDRLLRIQSREGANLEYLKNVVLSFLLTSDPYKKRHMLKAISAVLHFTDIEKENAYKAIS